MFRTWYVVGWMVVGRTPPRVEKGIRYLLFRNFLSTTRTSAIKNEAKLDNMALRITKKVNLLSQKGKERKSYKPRSVTA